MCGRYVILSPPAALRALFGYPEQPNAPPRYNVAPTQPVPVVLVENGGRHFRLMRWGFLPAWVKDPRTFALVINARAETVQEKPAFKAAIRRRRCLLPADGYYEWQQGASGKQPYFIGRRDGGPFGFAGVAETWLGPNGEELDTVAIVTTAAPQPLSRLHHRVPVIIAPGQYDLWLDCRNENPREAMQLLATPRSEEFVWHRVSLRVNAVAHDDAQLIAPITEEQAAAEAAARKAPARKRASSPADQGQGSLF
ncbi:MAG TPA: SOS response-associated peptidase [Nitrobacter sp.]|nr:SOS response-associated peptidase [Nitrobacter sp.]